MFGPAQHWPDSPSILPAATPAARRCGTDSFRAFYPSPPNSLLDANPCNFNSEAMVKAVIYLKYPAVIWSGPSGQARFVGLTVTGLPEQALGHGQVGAAVGEIDGGGLTEQFLSTQISVLSQFVQGCAPRWKLSQASGLVAYGRRVIVRLWRAPARPWRRSPG